MGAYRERLERIAGLIEGEARSELEAFPEHTSAARRAFVPDS